MTGKCFGEGDDGVVETMHQYLDKRMRISNYSVKNLESKSHVEKSWNLYFMCMGMICENIKFDLIKYIIYVCRYV